MSDSVIIRGNDDMNDDFTITINTRSFYQNKTKERTQTNP
jgi:hypothetical protein